MRTLPVVINDTYRKMFNPDGKEIPETYYANIMAALEMACDKIRNGDKRTATLELLEHAMAFIKDLKPEVIKEREMQ